ncbi:MAG TPA: DUF5989 family protein [Bdellovibrionales bacterium]|nr:DUF5989 family protein [Bdellovibrionales bacterium]
MELIKDFLGFMRHRKRYWLLPIVLSLLILALLILTAQGGSVAMIYTIF